MKNNIKDFLIKDELNEIVEIKRKLITNKDFIYNFNLSANIILNTLLIGKKIMIAGNGGSAADSQHFAAELISRFQKKRKHLAAMSLTVDSSVLTSISNDFGYKHIFSKQIEGIGNKEDVLICFTTSCKSQNIIEAIKTAKRKKIKVILFTGEYVPKKLIKDIDALLSINSKSTPRIQECHIFLYHSLCKIIDSNF